MRKRIPSENEVTSRLAFVFVGDLAPPRKWVLWCFDGTSGSNTKGPKQPQLSLRRAGKFLLAFKLAVAVMMFCNIVNASSACDLTHRNFQEPAPFTTVIKR